MSTEGLDMSDNNDPNCVCSLVQQQPGGHHMTDIDIITIIGGLAWLVVLVINQHVQYTNEDQS